jgi:osmotically inducible protein OsmC
MIMSKLTPSPNQLLDKYRGPDFEPLYTAKVRVAGGEAGHGRASGIVQSDDGNLQLELRMPDSLGGPGGGTNPEQLFAAGYAACFHGALKLLSSKAGIEVDNAVVEVSVSFGRDPVDGMYALTADVRIELPGVARTTAEQLVRSAERVCPYAKMARQGIQSVVALL